MISNRKCPPSPPPDKRTHKTLMLFKKRLRRHGLVLESDWSEGVYDARSKTQQGSSATRPGVNQGVFSKQSTSQSGLFHS